jgi:mRNA interferase RelE/StbE
VEPYSLRFKSSVEKDLRRIPAAARARCLERISALSSKPRASGARRLTNALHTYRIRVGTYRVICQIDDDERTVTIVYVRHRRDAYR